MAGVDGRAAGASATPSTRTADAYAPREAKRFSARRVSAGPTSGANAPGKRGELLERAFTHYLDGGRRSGSFEWAACPNGRGGMRRTHLRRHDNILKRLLVHVAGFNLGLVMRKLVGRGTPKSLAAALSCLFGRLFALCGVVERVEGPETPDNRRRALAAGYPAAA